ncbi:MAG: protein kinase, partial [Pyrinomonadaceae bacterium]|nr:protein kinase [Pyrinomonadaceae bacterium]
MKECPKCRSCYDDTILRCPLDDKYLTASIAGDGTINGRYVLEKRLGRGGMGIVFKAHHKFLKSSHAIKVILPNLVEEDESLLVRFRQEAILAASIQHPNVVGVTDFGVEDEMMPYLVMEFVDGVSLSSFVGQGTKLAPEKAYEIFLPIILGVGEAHRKGIVHRDLKPQNIMVQTGMPLRRAVKVLDFGLAKIKSSESLGSFVQAKTVSILGSPPYMSPEQWSNGDVDHRADIYGLGVMLYEMLTGSLPFEGDSIPAIVYQHLSVDPPSFASHGVTLSPNLEAVVRQALGKERESRPDSVEQMLAQLEAAIGSTGSTGNAVTVLLDRSSFPTFPIDNEAKTVVGNQDGGLTTTQKEKLHSYLDIPSSEKLLADKTLAEEFLQAQDRAEAAKEQVGEADKLANEFAEAQKFAEEAQRRAAEAQQKIVADVRRRVEAEMESKFFAEQQARQKAEAEARLLAEEAEARKKAEERANQLAEDALKAQQLAEKERKKAEKEIQQRELEAGVRRQAEVAAAKLTEQVAESKKKFEEAKQQAEYEAGLRHEAEAKRRKIEDQIIVIAEKEAERRRVAEAKANQQVKEQASRYESEALAAHQRVEEAKRLAEFEAGKREQAEQAQMRAEQEAQRLAQEIIEVQKRIEEIKHQSNPQTGGMKTLNLLNPTTDERLSETISNDYIANTAPEISVGAAFKPSSDASQTANLIHFGGQNVAAPNQPPTAQNNAELEASRRFQPESSVAPGFLSQSSGAQRKSPVLKIAAGAVGAFFILIFGGAIYFLTGNSASVTKSDGVPDGKITTSASGQPTIEKTSVGGNRVGTKMSLVSGGTFQMGSSDVSIDDPRWQRQYPAHSATVGNFYLDKTEVSNEE